MPKWKFQARGEECDVKLYTKHYYNNSWNLADGSGKSVTLYVDFILYCDVMETIKSQVFLSYKQNKKMLEMIGGSSNK